MRVTAPQTATAAQSQPTGVMDAVDVMDVRRLELYCNAAHFILRATSCGLFTQAICRR
jgi:hypothetical protein